VTLRTNDGRAFFLENPIFLEKAIEPALVVITEARLVPFVLGVALPKLKTRLTDVAVLA